MKQFILAILVILTTLSASAKNEVAKPDFAYPEKVSADAQKHLDKALASGDGRGVISSLINYTIAQSLIDKDCLPATVKHIEQIAQAEKDPCTRALLYTLLVDIYIDIYNYDSSKYNNRNNELLPLPDDITTWDEKQFRHKIVTLSNSALENADALQASPLKEYSTIINFDRETLIYYPTLFDFVARQICVQIDRIYPRSTNPIPQTWFCNTQEFLNLEIPNAIPIQQLLLTTYKSLIRANLNKVAPLISCEISRLTSPSISYSLIFDIVGETLRSLYDSFSNSEYSGDILQHLNIYNYDTKWLYNAVNNNIERFPQYHGINWLKNLRNSLTPKKISTQMSEIIVPGDSLSVSIYNNNITNYTLNLYRLPDSDRFYYRSISNPNTAKHQLIKSVQVKTDSIVPFNIQQNVKFSIEQPGYYYITTNLNGAQSQKNSYPLILCSDIYILRSDHEQSVWATVVNPKTGAPITNADIYSIHKDYPDSKIATTDKAGHALLPKDIEYIAAIKNGNRSNYIYCGNQIYGHPSNSQDGNSTKAHSFVDLPLYHPGDSVHWSAIVYSDANKLSLSVGQSLTAEIRDANYNVFDEVNLITDKWGRVNYSFKLPVDGLSGKWSITLKEDKRPVSVIYLTVSDYKLPTFFIEFTSTDKDAPNKGDITLKGKVVSFSGMPLANTTVTINLVAASRRWFRDNYESYYSTKLATDNNGKFAITLSENILDTAPYPRGVYTIKATATTPSGESQHASTFINRGAVYEISQKGDNRNFAVDKYGYVSIKLQATDINNISGDFEVNYQVLDNEKHVSSTGKTTIANATINANGLKSGEYSILFTPVDTLLAEPFKISNIILYRNNDAMPPIGTLLWIPTTSYTVDKDAKSATISYGTSYDNCYIDMAVCTDNRIFSRKWLTPKAGNHTITIDIPSDCNYLSVNMCVLHNYTYKSNVITISRQDTNTIDLKVESFRDKITPNTTETWKFSVTDQFGKGTKSALIFDMYNKALDKLHGAYSWIFSPQPKQSPTYIFDLQLRLKTSDYQYITSEYLECDTPKNPKFNTWGQSFLNRHQVFMSLSIDECVVQTNNVAKSSFAEAKGEAEIDNTNSQETYRPSEIALAFFEPNLVTDDQGNLTYTFTAPNANTTWSFNAVAYSERLATAHMNCDVVANKPIMVQPNLPRFLRTGDKAVIKAAIQNNTDEVQTTVTTIEIFNLANNEVLSQWQFTDTIDAMQSAINDIVVDAPFDMPMLGYRIKSTNGTFTDGEQAVISILPSTTPVIDTDNFYMSPQIHRKDIKMGIAPDNTRTTLLFCENPIWYCVTALPGMRNSESTSANSAIAAIYSAAIADGIMRNNPNIASALHQWINSDNRDSTLTSMLERNQDLKTVLLNATPWMMDAHSDSERMARLALLFDKKEIRRVYHENITLLGQLQNADGGWRWIKQSNITSTWTTLNVLVMCGHMKKLGYLPDNQPFNTMIKKAVKYIDDHYARQYAKYPKANTDYTRYVYVRDYFDDIKQSTAAARVTAATVQALLSDWKEYNILGKSVAALILNNHSYSNTARQVLNSLRQYSRYTPDNGMWWPSVDYDSTIDKVGITAIALDAFNAIEPKCEDIDRIRQWLILQKNATDWGNSVNTTLAIHSIISTGTKWTTPARGVEIALDGTEISTSKFETATGYIRTDISALSPSGKTLAIAKPASTPAWGAIFRQFTQTMTDVRAAACDDLSIEKQLYRQVPTANGITWQKADSISLGDVVKVALTIKANRDLDYVTIIDDRAACFEPVEQLPQPIFTEGIYFYRENRDAATNIFVDHLPKGTYVISYELNANNIGSYSSGIAKIQSQYAPNITAHSAGSSISISR